MADNRFKGARTTQEIKEKFMLGKRSKLCSSIVPFHSKEQVVIDRLLRISNVLINLLIHDLMVSPNL